MKYSKRNGIHIVEVPVRDFRVILCDAPKKSGGSNYANAGFFGNFKEGRDTFTLPVGHVVADYTATSPHTRHYCGERGEFHGKKLTFDCGKWAYGNQFYGKPVSTLVISGGRAKIEDLKTLPSVDYAVSGIPIIRTGQDVLFSSYVKSQGWNASPLYATWHTFVGVKADRSLVYVMGMKTKTGNMITSGEAYKAFKELGFQDVIKLDGGGSFHFNVGGKVKQTTLGNRRINTIISFSRNPWPSPTRTLVKGRKGADVKWLQWELRDRGFVCDVDGSFGPGTKAALIKFQASVGLTQDGSCGPATRTALGG